MWFASPDFLSFWFAAWSLPLRAACPWASAQARQCANRKLPIPKWLAPQCLQRWVGEAIATRVAWQQAHPAARAYRFGRRSEPCWSQTAALPYDQRVLHRLEEAALLWLWGMDLERLLRIVLTPAAEVGEDLWTETALGGCAHLGQVYRELKRRYKAPQARALVWGALRFFVVWRAEEAGAATADALLALPG